MSNHGWKSRHDIPGMPNIERLAGRILHRQENAWAISKVFYVILAALILYLIKNGDIGRGIHGVLSFYQNYLR